jgi:hypothetical protein
LVGGGDADSVASRLRRKRWQRLADSFPDLSDMRVLDLGGTAESWLLCPSRPGHVTLLNLWPDATDLGPRFDQVQGDACRPPDTIMDGDWDLVYSNSVIEHVGGYARRREFSDVVRGLAPAYWVQTPNRYFPIEPHWLFPGFQFLPVAARTTIAMKWPLYTWRSDDRNRALREVLEIELLSRTELVALFPEAHVLPERFAGLTKSYIAVRTGTDQPDSVRVVSDD